MSLDWYHVFIAIVLVLWVFSAPRDKNALRIVLIASLVSEVMVDLVTHQIHDAWKLALPGALEVLTILALCQWSKNRTGHLNSGLLGVAWIAHILCYLDAWLHTDIVYSQYETIIQIVALGQLASFHDTLLHMARSVRGWTLSLRVGRVRGVQPASVRADLLRAGDSSLP